MQYVLKKTGVLIATLLLVSLFAFLAFEIIPGDPTTMLLGSEYTPERAETLRHSMGLDRNVFVRYCSWLLAFLRGDMGTSYSYAMPVREVLRGKILVTVVLSIMSWVLVTALSMPMGVALVRYQNKPFGKIGVSVNQVLMAVPPFFLGILLTYLFGLLLRAFTPGRFVPLEENIP